MDPNISIFSIPFISTTTIYHANITNCCDTHHSFLPHLSVIFIERDQIVRMMYNFRLYESINCHLQYHKYKQNFYHNARKMFCFWLDWYSISIVVVLYYKSFIFYYWKVLQYIITVRMHKDRLNHVIKSRIEYDCSTQVF